MSNKKLESYKKVINLIHYLYVNQELRTICKLALLEKFDEALELANYIKKEKDN